MSANKKDWYLPVTSFEEIKLGEKTKYQATIATPELVTYQADKRDFSTGHTFDRSDRKFQMNTPTLLS